MSFSFVVNGHAQTNISPEEEMDRVRVLVQDLLSGGEDEGIHIRIDAFNPPSWAPAVQENFQQDMVEQTAAQGSVGDTGQGAMGAPQTPTGEQTQTSTTE